MTNSQDTKTPAEVQVPSQESNGNHQNNKGNEDAGSVSISSSDNRKVSREEIEFVQNLIERCLQLYMNKGEVVRTLSTRARIEPGFTTLVWQKLEEENAEFFRAYYIRLKLKKQIILFNHLLEHQYHLMKYPMPPKVPLVPLQNGMHHMPVNSLPMGYPVIPQPPIPANGHLDSMGLSNCHVVNGIPAQSNFHPMHMNSGNDIMQENGTHVAGPTIPMSTSMSSMPEMSASPGPDITKNNHFPFTSEIPGMEMDASALDQAFSSDVNADGGLGRNSVRSLGQMWNFSLTDLTADLGDLGALGEYTGSAFLPSDSDILLGSPEQADRVEDYFADTINSDPVSDEEKT